MTAAAQAAPTQGCAVHGGFNYRRVTARALARELIAEGRLGIIRHVRAVYLQDWLADESAPMAWRPNRETAGSGAFGDIAQHAIDQVLFLLGDRVTEVSGRLHISISHRPGADGPEEVTVDDAAWASLALSSGAIASIEAHGVATGKKNALTLEIQAVCDDPIDTRQDGPMNMESAQHAAPGCDRMTLLLFMLWM